MDQNSKHSRLICGGLSNDLGKRCAFYKTDGTEHGKTRPFYKTDGTEHGKRRAFYKTDGTDHGKTCAFYKTDGTDHGITRAWSLVAQITFVLPRSFKIQKDSIVLLPSQGQLVNCLCIENQKSEHRLPTCKIFIQFLKNKSKF